MGIVRLNVCGICGQLFHPLLFCFCFLFRYSGYSRHSGNSYLKSSDLSMVNPHISLNLQNPPIHGAILRFSEDFYCEIHGFHWQSSDLAGGFILVKSSGGSEEFIYFVWVSVWWREPWLPFTQSMFLWQTGICRWCFLRSPLRTQTDLTQIGLDANLSVLDYVS